MRSFVMASLTLSLCYNFRRLERCEIGHQPNASDRLR